MLMSFFYLGLIGHRAVNQEGWGGKMAVGERVNIIFLFIFTSYLPAIFNMFVFFLGLNLLEKKVIFKVKSFL
jgi:hypothetical protein